MFRAILMGAALASMSTASVAANPAAKLSVSKASRTGTVRDGEKLAGGGVLVAVLAVAVAIGVVVAVSGGDEPDSQ